MAQSIKPLSSLGWFDALCPGARGAGGLSTARPPLYAASLQEKPGSRPLQGLARLVVLFLQGSVPSSPCTDKRLLVPVSQVGRTSFVVSTP
jgi:hypothetical protein